MMYHLIIVILFFFLLPAFPRAQELSLPFPEPDQIEVFDAEDSITPEEAPAEPKLPVVAPPAKESVKKSAIKKKKPVLTDSDKKKETNKKDKKKEEDAEGDTAYKIGQYHLQAGNLAKAEAELQKAGGNPDAQTELILVKAKTRKYEEAEKLADAIEDPEKQMKARLLLANTMAADNILAERALDQYYKIIAGENSWKPGALIGIAWIFHRKQDFKSALEYLSRIILEFPDSEFLDDAYYLCGRIYETPGVFRNTAYASRFYGLFMKNMDKDSFKTSVYAGEVKRRLKLLASR